MANPFFYSCAVRITPAVNDRDARLFDALVSGENSPEARSVLDAIESDADTAVSVPMDLFTLNPLQDGFRSRSDDPPDLLAAWLRLIIRHLFQPRGYSIEGRIAWIEASDGEASGCIFIHHGEVEVAEDDWLLNRGPSWNRALVLDWESKQTLRDLIDSSDATGCSEELTVVSAYALEQVRKYLDRTCDA